MTAAVDGSAADAGADGAQVTACYVDNDGDGIGAGDPVPCAAQLVDSGVGGGDDAASPRTTVDDAGDCDDADPARAPGLPELCDAVDNDCDDEVDEEWEIGASCSGVGECGEGVWECAGTDARRCSSDPGGSKDASLPEVCDGKDNNCDGKTDETWEIGAACVGVGECGLGAWECAGAASRRCSSDPGGSMDASLAEVCDGLDNDCDGVQDNGVLNACGQCGPVPGEVCDGLDNDCDGVTDDGLPFRDYWADCDRDGYGDGAAINACSMPSGSCPYVTNKTDCSDKSANMKPGQTAYFGTSISGSFDYNCDGKVEKQNTLTANNRGGCGVICTGLPYWSGSTVPECGVAGVLCSQANNWCQNCQHIASCLAVQACR
jgi:hypothetical protein